MSDIKNLLKFQKFGFKKVLLAVGDKHIDLKTMKIVKASDKVFVCHAIKKGKTVEEEEALELAKKYIIDLEACCKSWNVSISDCIYSPTHLSKVFSFELFKDKEFDELDSFEIEHIRNGNHNGYMIYVDTETKTNENTTTYDLNSFYPLCMMGSFAIRLNKGKHIKLTEMPEHNSFFNFAYYLVEVTDKKPLHFQTKATTLWLTNFDILTFIMFECPFKFKQDCQYNCYTYVDSKTMRTEKRHKDLIKNMYSLKSNGNKIAKDVLIQMHGVMFSNERKTHNNIKNGAEIIEEMNSEGVWVCRSKNELAEVRGGIKYNWERFKPFYYSYTRYLMSKHVHALQLKNVKINRIYCDSISCDKTEYFDDKMGEEIGKFKLEEKKWNGKVGYFSNCKLWEEKV